MTLNTENLTDKMQFVIDQICKNLCFTEEDMQQYNVTMRTLKALQSRGIIDIDAYAPIDGEQEVFCDFTTEGHKYYVNHSETYAENSSYDENGKMKVILPKKNTTDNLKTAPKSNDSLYPAIVTIGGANHGEVKPNPECSENRYGQLVKSDEYGEYLEPTDKSKAYAQRKLTQYKRLITLISTEERKVEKQIADCREKSPTLQFGGLAWKRNKQLIAVLENRLKVLTKRHHKVLGYRWHFLATQFATEVWQLEH